MNFKIITVLMLGIMLAGVTTLNAQNAMKTNQQKTNKVVHPEWTKNSNIYEVNIRQFTKEGNFKAFAKHLTVCTKWALIFFGLCQ